MRVAIFFFLCLGPDCARSCDGEETWDYLKRQCKKLDLPVMRTKAGCFRICVGGPWLLIYPEGVWYGEVTPKRCERNLRYTCEGEAGQKMGGADSPALRRRTTLSGGSYGLDRFSC